MRQIARLIETEGVTSQGIASVGKSACPRSTADLTQVANSAFALKLPWGMQGSEEGRIAVDFNQRTAANIAAGQRQKARGIHFAQVGNEHDSVTITNLETFGYRTP